MRHVQQLKADINSALAAGAKPRTRRVFVGHKVPGLGPDMWVRFTRFDIETEVFADIIVLFTYGSSVYSSRNIS